VSTRATRETITVGVDGSPSSSRAIEYAVADAVRRSATLRLVHAFAWPYLHVPTGPAPGTPADGGLRGQAEQVLSTARSEADAAAAAIAATDLKVDVALVDGFPVAVLMAESTQADMIVIGDRGLGGFAGLLLGSTATQMISHSHGPVTVVRGNTVRTGNVVAGVDGSASSLAALKFAAAEARRRGVDVEAVMAWARPRPTSPGDLLPLVYEPAAIEHEARAVMSEAASAARAASPDVCIIERLVHGRARRTLVGCSENASLLIVGRHTHEFGSLGSVAGALTHHAYCPVAVVPAHDLRA